MRKLRTIEMQRLTVEEFKASEKLPLTVVLDDVRSLYNVGSVFRTADAFRVAEVCLCGITACPPHPEIHKTALGGEDSVEWRYFPQHSKPWTPCMLRDVLSMQWSRWRVARCWVTSVQTLSSIMLWSSAMRSKGCIRRWLTDATVVWKSLREAPSTR